MEQNKNSNLNSPIPADEIKGITTGKRVKKTSLEKVGNAFVGEDMKKVKSYILKDVVVPNLKKLVSEVIKNGTDMILYHGDKPVSSSRDGFYKDYNKGYTGRTSYNTMNINKSYERQSDNSLDNLMVNSYSEGRLVLNRMDELISAYGIISIYETCKLIKVPGQYTDYDWGWNDIRGAEIVPFRGAFLLKMPRPIAVRR